MAASFIESLSSDPARVVGWAVLGGLVIQLGFMISGSIRRAVYERRRAGLEAERLLLEIKAAVRRLESVAQVKSAWNGHRKFSVERKVAEAEDTFSIYLKPHDGKPLPLFQPGQYLTFQLAVPGQTKPVVRCYSLSDSHRQSHYRITVRRCTAPEGSGHPPGAASSFFCDTIREGDIVDVKAPGGQFVLDLEKKRPVVLISGGVGVTPMISMLNALVETASNREIWFFFGARNSAGHLFREHMAAIAAQHPNVRLHVCYSKPLPGDVEGRDYQHRGHVSVDLFKTLLPSNNYDYFLCGPGAFMEAITDDLRTWGVPDAWVHFEAFGPASVKRAASPEVKATLTQAPFGGREVVFAKSKVTAPWTGSHTNVLALAEEHGVKISAGCRAGNCGSCLVAVTSGEVDYLGDHGADVERGSCLPCICLPKGRLVIDA